MQGPFALLNILIFVQARLRKTQWIMTTQEFNSILENSIYEKVASSLMCNMYCQTNLEKGFHCID